MHRKIDISHKTIFFIAGFIALLWALFLIKEVIILLFVAIIIMSSLAPIVELFERRFRIPKTISIALIYLIMVGIVAGMMYLVLTPLIEQTSGLLQNLPHTIETTLPNLPIDKSLLQDQLGNLSKNAFSFGLAIFSNFLALVSVVVLSFYLLLEHDKLDRLLTQFFIGKEDKVKSITDKIEEKLGSWFRGQVVLSVLISVLCYIVLSILRIPYALPLAILAGLMEVLPVIGPIISAIPAILIAYLVSPIYALIVAGAYLVIQQLEAHLIVPQVMKKAVGLNPLIVILAVSIGGKLLGLSGALLAVPIAVVIQVITENILREET